MTVQNDSLKSILDSAAAEGRSSLLEHEVYSFLAAAGCTTPRFHLVKKGEQPDEAAIRELGGDRVMLKIVSPQIAHKTDVGGVKKVAADPKVVAEGIARMLDEVPRNYARILEAKPGHGPKEYEGLSGKALEEAIAKDIRGVLVVEMVQIDGEGVGSEAIFALRHNREFGPVITMGIGGVDTELLGEACKKGLAVISASAALLEPEELLAAFKPTLAYRRLAGLTRTKQRLVEDAEIVKLLAGLKAIAAELGHDGEGEGWTVTELEMNPFVASRGRLVALDGLLKFRKRAPLPLPRPLGSLEQLLTPRSLGIIGVSTKGMNMGRIILNNIVEAGFDRSHMYVVRPGADEIDGVRCVPSAKDLPERVDLFIVAIGAEQVPGLMEELVEHDKAVGVILIPGGMAEKEGGEVHEARLMSALRKARELGRPLVANGGNCLGIYSKPGRYHTLFIPTNKLELRHDGRSNVAYLSQSGAYMISRMSKLAWLTPRYAVSTGNQADLTIGDFVRYLARDPEVKTFAVYIEGFKDADGLEFAKAVREVVAHGRDVIFYKAGRTAEGMHATSGHTASLAGDYDVCEAVVKQAGAIVARTFEEYLDLVRISALMGDKAWKGRRLAALSNAGFEAVGISDSLRGDGWDLQLARLGPECRELMKAALVKGKLDSLVDVRNPFDLTPMADDEAHEDAVRAFLDDDEVDLVLCSTIPLTARMATLGPDAPEEQSIRSPGSLVNRLARVMKDAKKPVVVSIDSGYLYDPMARAFEEKGLPTFRSAERAVKAMGLYVESKLRR
ncbi:MAG: acetate--CoA ligase family protein [Myxococcales bacterium]|jgi:acyl-CoA synthetase (NDP forming)